MAWWVPLAISAAGALMKSSANDDQQGEQNDLISRKSDYQQARSADSIEQQNKFLATLTPEARAQQLNTERAGLSDNYAKNLAATIATEAPTVGSGKVTSDFTRSVAANKAKTAAMMDALTKNLSVMGASGQRGLATDRTFVPIGQAISGANMASNNVGNLYDYGVKNIRAPAGKNLIGGILSGMGASGFGGKAFGGANVAGLESAASNGLWDILPAAVGG